MSLINDALKRARDVDRERRGTPPGIPLQPVEPAAQGRPKSWWVILALVVVALSLSVWSFSRWAGTAPPSSRSQLTSAATEKAVRLPETAPVTPREVQPTHSNSSAPYPVAPAPASSPAPTTGPQNPEPLPAPSSDPIVESSATPQPSNAPPAEIAPPPPIEAPPPLRLQSILYRPRNPAVVINGQFLQEGDTIAGARILKIEREQVTLEGEETNIVLSMPRY